MSGKQNAREDAGGADTATRASPPLNNQAEQNIFDKKIKGKIKNRARSGISSPAAGDEQKQGGRPGREAPAFRILGGRVGFAHRKNQMLAEGERNSDTIELKSERLPS